jgi:hypothetical protein
LKKSQLEKNISNHAEITEKTIEALKDQLLNLNKLMEDTNNLIKIKSEALAACTISLKGICERIDSFATIYNNI